MIQATVAINNILVQWDVTPFIDNLIGYHLERAIPGGDWQVWDGAAWGTVEQLLPDNVFVDKAPGDGVYQYRVIEVVNAEVSPPPQFQTTSWVRLGGDPMGWMFGNYTVPQGQWGEVLTADDMRHHFLWGIDAKASNGAVMTDAQMSFQVEAAITELERYLNFDFRQKVIVCELNDNLSTTPHDETEPPYPFRHDRWQKTGLIPTRRRPVQSVQRFELWSIVNQKIMDLLPWLRLNGARGHMHFFPKVGPAGVINVNPIAALGFNAWQAGGDYPHGYRIDYTIGLTDASKVPADVRVIIGKIAALQLMGVIGDGLIAGFSSSSLSLDGVSESFSSTQSPENTFFGARMKGYVDDVKRYLTDHRNKFSGFPIGTI